eukprot:TRINITY_DN31256_c0_g1_i1.p2 TRINITY_DN31256_c0_g1~~TRINITY_DN31256_c0_g1_i1.p2  ORF type:complete len:207 (-),score=5.78 TRINITY_DN31256_c0_g1_i1:1258-1878(-)
MTESVKRKRRTRKKSAMGSALGKISVETPKYEVVTKGDDFEIREYEPCVSALVTYESSASGRGRDGGFNTLAHYIGAFGTPQNTSSSSSSSEKISMTAPVITSSSSEKEKAQVTMEFVLPSKYTIDNAPRPTDSRVLLKEYPKRKYAVMTFSGVADDAKVERVVSTLTERAQARGYEVAGDPLLARYNPPWTLPFLRTNEVLLPLK